ncbi:hypothetical protein AHF37_12439 [Paragonimus kellicotti]|nr:hypothetical protein AHF37_12439 [Paragonimus kellicotti]
MAGVGRHIRRSFPFCKCIWLWLGDLPVSCFRGLRLRPHDSIVFANSVETFSTDEPRGYPPEDYPPFMAPKGFGQNDPRAPPRRRSPEPRYNYRASEKPFYPPRDGWYRGPSPNR